MTKLTGSLLQLAAAIVVLTLAIEWAVTVLEPLLPILVLAGFGAIGVRLLRRRRGL